MFLVTETSKNETIISTTPAEVLVTSTSTQLDILMSELEKASQEEASENNFFLIIEEEDELITTDKRKVSISGSNFFKRVIEQSSK